jgi:protein SCO1/2
MQKASRKVGWVIWCGLLLVVLTVLLAALAAAVRMRGTIGKPLPVYGTVTPFTLTNQFGQTVTLSNLLGRVCLADIIFTRCAGPCPRMTQHMKSIQDALPATSSTRLVSLTTDPDFDTPAVLRAYAQRFGADPNRWLFLTGQKGEIARLARDSLKLTSIEKTPDQRESLADLFIHSTIFVLVDKAGRLRGVYETVGEGINPETVKSEIMAGIRRLEREK